MVRWRSLFPAITPGVNPEHRTRHRGTGEPNLVAMKQSHYFRKHALAALMIALAISPIAASAQDSGTTPPSSTMSSPSAGGGMGGTVEEDNDTDYGWIGLLGLLGLAGLMRRNRHDDHTTRTNVRP